MDTKEPGQLLRKHPLLLNVIIILAVAFIGIWIVYFSVALFTKHGEETVVPGVENMSYTQAVELLHSKGFNVDIRDSLFRDDVKPGFVIEQFPKAKSIVKPGRKIFLYINAVHPKEVVIDDGGDRTVPALKDWSFRQVKSRLLELGFKNIGVVSVLGADDRVVKLTANGRPVYQMEKIPVNARILIEVSDGRLAAVRDSLYEAERLRDYNNQVYGSEGYDPWYTDTESTGKQSEKSTEEVEYYEEPDYFLLDE